MSTNRVLCPECKGKLDLDSRLEVGEEVTCSRCSTDWKVVRRAPLVLDRVDEELVFAGAKRWVMRDVRTQKTPARQFWPMG